MCFKYLQENMNFRINESQNRSSVLWYFNLRKIGETMLVSSLICFTKMKPYVVSRSLSDYRCRIVAQVYWPSVKRKGRMAERNNSLRNLSRNVISRYKRVLLHCQPLKHLPVHATTKNDNRTILTANADNNGRFSRERFETIDSIKIGVRLAPVAVTQARKISLRREGDLVWGSDTRDRSSYSRVGGKFERQRDDATGWCGAGRRSLRWRRDGDEHSYGCEDPLGSTSWKHGRGSATRMGQFSSRRSGKGEFSFSIFLYLSFFHCVFRSSP